MTLLDEIDPRLQPALFAEWARRRGEHAEGLPRDVTVVLAGHRAAGKSRLLPHVARAMGREAVDLDTELERRFQRPLRPWVTDDEPGFRLAERETFRTLPQGLVVAVGGGFLAHHAEALQGCVVVEVPITFPTYAARLSADTSRPRLRPDLTLEEELREVYTERETRHAAARPMRLLDFMLRLERGRRARRVVTLAPHVPIERFAWAARHAGAELLEVRSDLHPREVDLLAASRALPLLVARRTPQLPVAWCARASLVDEPLDDPRSPSPESPRSPSAEFPRSPSAEFPRSPSAEFPRSPRAESRGASSPGDAHVLDSARTERIEGVLFSLHAEASMTTQEALAAWAHVPTGARVKHVEPLGAPRDFPRLLATQAALLERFGAERVTVLCTGPLALPFRAVLAQRNALDYLALDGSWAAAPGQRLLADVVREARRAHVDGTTRRLGILGHGIAFSRSPRLHQQPFDRIELPVDAPLAELLAALHPYYRGFAVTAPFKKAAAAAVGSTVPAINTLARTQTGWHAENSDVAGATAVLDAFLGTAPGSPDGTGPRSPRAESRGASSPGDGQVLDSARTERKTRSSSLLLPAERGEGRGEGPTLRVTVLGDGGVTAALRLAAAQRNVELRVLTRDTIPDAPLTGPVVWTWPANVELPSTLRFRDAQVALVAYGPPAHLIAKQVVARGGTPRRWGPRWFIAQARQQRSLWEASS